MDRAGDKAIAFQRPQRQRQHALRYAAHLAPDLAEALRPAAQQIDHQNGPLVAYSGEHGADRLAVAGQVHVPWFQKCASLRIPLARTYVALVT